MPDSQIAPRRLPFQIGTITIFVQAVPPVGWVQESINDRFLRVVNAGGGVVAGPDNRTVNSIDLSHTHSIPSHSHAMGTHTHNVNHNHDLPLITGGMVDFSEASIEGSEAYNVKDDSGAFDSSHHLRVDGGGDDEGQHDHDVGGSYNGTVTGTFSGSTNASPDSTSPTSATSDPASTSMVHSHEVHVNFRPRYKDVILARIVS